VTDSIVSREVVSDAGSLSELEILATCYTQLLRHLPTQVLTGSVQLSSWCILKGALKVEDRKMEDLISDKKYY